jgi:hypothetical protein
MIELLNIYFLILIFLTISLCLPRIFFKNQEYASYNFIHYLGFNFIIFLNLILILSFFNINKILLLSMLLVICLFYLALNISKFKKLFQKDKIYSFLFLFLIFVVSIYIANNFNLSWDAKGYYLKRTLSFLDGYFLPDNFIWKYQPFFPDYLKSFFWKNSFVDHEYAGRLVFGYIYLLSVFYFFSFSTINQFLKIICALIFILISFKGEYFDGRPTILLFSFFLFLAGEFFEIFSRKKITLKNYFFIILIMNLILWTKTEGLAYAIIIYLTTLYFLRFDNKSKFILTAAIVILISFKYIIYYLYNLPLNPHEQVLSFSIIERINIESFLETILLTLMWYFISLLKNPLMIIGFISVFYLYFYSKKDFLRFNFLYLLFILKLFVIIGAHIFIVNDLSWQLKYSLDRIIYHSSSFFVIIPFYLFQKFLIKIK